MDLQEGQERIKALNIPKLPPIEYTDPLETLIKSHVKFYRFEKWGWTFSVHDGTLATTLLSPTIPIWKPSFDEAIQDVFFTSKGFFDIDRAVEEVETTFKIEKEDPENTWTEEEKKIKKPKFGILFVHARMIEVLLMAREHDEKKKQMYEKSWTLHAKKNDPSTKKIKDRYAEMKRRVYELDKGLETFKNWFKPIEAGGAWRVLAMTEKERSWCFFCNKRRPHVVLLNRHTDDYRCGICNSDRILYFKFYQLDPGFLKEKLKREGKDKGLVGRKTEEALKAWHALAGSPDYATEYREYMEKLYPAGLRPRNKPLVFTYTDGFDTPPKDDLREPMWPEMQELKVQSIEK